MSAVAILTMANCGGGGEGSDRTEIAETIETMQADFAAGRVKSLCRSLTTAVHEQIGFTGHATPTDCPFDVSRFLDLLDDGGGILDRRLAVERVAVDGDEAVVTLSSPEGTVARVPLRKQDGRWKVTNFFGATTMPFPRPDAPSTFPIVGSEQVTDSGAPIVANCPAVRPVSRFRVRGGCVARSTAEELEYTVRTPVGKFLLGRCNPRSTVRLDARGRIWIDGFMQSTNDGSACGDVRACRGTLGRNRDRSLPWDSGRSLPWRGQLRIAPNGAFVGQVSVCLATCVGRFEGKTDVQLVKTPVGWRLELDGAPVGRGGMTLDGSWDLSDTLELSLTAQDPA